MLRLAILYLLLATLCSCSFVPYRVMVMDFENNTSLKELEYFATAVPEFLTATLANEEICQLLERQDMRKYFMTFKPDAEVGKDGKWNRLKWFGETIGADYLVLGSISKLDDNYILQARLFSVQEGAIIPGSAVWQSCASQKEIFDRSRFIGKSLAYKLAQE